MRIHLNKRIHLVSASSYVIAAKTITSYQVNGERYVLVKIDRRTPNRRARLTLIQPRSAQG